MLSFLAKWNPIVNLEIPLIRKETDSKGKIIWNDEMDKEYEDVDDFGRVWKISKK